MTAPPISRTRRWACNIAAAGIIFAISTVFWMAIDRDPPFVRISGKIIPENPRAGQWVESYWQVKGSRWCPGSLRRQVIDSHDVVWSLDPGPIAFGIEIPVGSPDFRRRFQLPPKAEPGRAVYRVTTAYVCNPLHRWWPVVTTGPDVPFDIAPSPEQPGIQGERGERGPQGERGERGEQGEVRP
jgi:hypothetical protein